MNFERNSDLTMINNFNDLTTNLKKLTITGFQQVIGLMLDKVENGFLVQLMELAAYIAIEQVGCPNLF